MKAKHTKLPQRDLEMLSAYIDGQLTDRQTRRLEARLKQEPHLKTELMTLRSTVQSLGALPAPRLRRHFTLTPEMVGQTAARRSFPVLRLATALAGLAFVALVGVEGLQSLSGAQLAARAPAIMQEAEVAQDVMATTEAPMAAAPAEEQPAELEAMEAPAEGEPVEEPEAPMMEAPEAEEGVVGEEQAQKVTGTPEAALTLEDEADQTAESRVFEQTEQESDLQGYVEADTAEQRAPEAPNVAGTERSEQPVPARLSALRWLQVITGTLFILLSVLTFTIRRRPV